MSKELTNKGQRDLELINRALKTGDPKAYSELMNLYRDPLFYMFYEKVGDEDLAKDLTIESLGKAFKKLHLYLPDYAFSTWLFTVARNHAIDYLRKRKLQTISIDKVLISDSGQKNIIDLPSSVDDPEKIFIKKQRIKILRKIVNMLKPKYRTLVKLRYFKEFSYDEISKELNMPLGSVKAQLHRSREQLFKIIADTRDTF